MKKGKNSTKNSKRHKQDDYHQRIQNYKQDIVKIKSQVSQLQQKLDEQTDYDSTIDLTDDFLQDKYPTKVTKAHEQVVTRKGKDRLAKKKHNAFPENEELNKVAANTKSKNYQTRQVSPAVSTDHQKKKQNEDNKNDIETPSLENYNQILTDNKVLAHKIKNLLASNSNLDEENKSLKEKNDSLNQQNHDLNDQLTINKSRLAKLEKLYNELNSKTNSPIINKRNTSKRSKSVTKVPVMIDTNQIKEEVNSKEDEIDKIFSLEDDNINHTNRNEESPKSAQNNKKLKEIICRLTDEASQKEKKYQSEIDKLTTENKELRDQLENSPRPLVESSSTKKLREADSLTIADLTDKIALLEEENRKLRSKGLSATSVNIENQDLKRQLNRKQRSRPIDSETIANLTEKISDLTEENNNLKRSLISSRSIRNENEELKEKIDKLQNANMNEIKIDLDSDFNEPNSHNNLQEKIASLTKENNELKSQVITNKSLERENQKLQHKYNSLIETIRKIKPDQTGKKQIEKLKETVETLSKETNNSKSNSFRDNDNEIELKKLNEELSSSRNLIDRMEKEFALQKRELKDNYDSLLKEITNDIQNQPSSKEVQLTKKVKMLEQEIENQKKLFNSLEGVNQKLQEQYNQTRANNLSLIKQIDEMNHQIEQLTGNTSSLQFSDQSDHFDKNKNNNIYQNNNEYDQIKTDFVQIHKALNEVPDSSDSYSSKINQLKALASSHAKDSKKQIDSANQRKNSSSPSTLKSSFRDSNGGKNKNQYQLLKNNEENKNANILDDADDEDDVFLNDYKAVDMLSDNINDTDTENDDIDQFLNDNFTESDTEIDNKNISIKNAILNDTDSSSNKDAKVSATNATTKESKSSSNNNHRTPNNKIPSNAIKDIKSPNNNSNKVPNNLSSSSSDIIFNQSPNVSTRSPSNSRTKKTVNNNNYSKSPKKKFDADSVNIDDLLNTSGADFSTTEAFRDLYESQYKNKDESSTLIDEEFEKLKASFSSSLDEKEKRNNEKSPKKNKKAEYLLIGEDDDDKTFSS